MAAQQQKLDAVANDLANTNTTGYKQVRVGFTDLLYSQAGRPAANGVELGTGAKAVNVGRNFEQGGLQQTGQPLDVAIQGDGFFKVKINDGRTVLTRDGDLHTDANGNLVNNAGLLQPKITIPKGVTEDQISIATDGTVTAGGTKVGTIALFKVANPQGLAVRRRERLRHDGRLGQRHGRAEGHHADAGRARGVQHGHLRGDGRHDQRPAHLPADFQGHPDGRPDDGDRQPGEAMTQIPGLPTISDLQLPTAVREGSDKDKQNYKTAMGFEQMLVGQLVQSMVGSDAAVDSGSGDEDGTPGVSNPLASGPFAGQMQDALSSALMGAGGLGLAGQIYKGMRSS